MPLVPTRSALMALCFLLGLAGLATAQRGKSPPPDPKGLAVPSTPAASERRLALVIGNAKYQFADRLKNAVNDAEDIAKVLRTLQFQVLLKTDVPLDSMAEALFQFGEQLKGGGVGLFYYSGHGMQVKGENYLIPVDANVLREDEMKRKTLSVRDVLEKMDEAKSHLNLVFLDACRNNPFPRSVRSATRGLTGMNAPSGTLLVFATSPDNVASDGSGRNGAYTKHLLQQITQPGLEVAFLLREVRTAVRTETNGQQVPWENGSIEGRFYFNGTGSAAVVPPVVTQPPPEPPRPTPATPTSGTQVAVGLPPEPAPTYRNSLGMAFVLIQPGTFQMGSNDGDSDEKPVHTVRLSQAFYLGAHEVTQAQWEAVMGNNPSQYKGDPSRPVEKVSWDDVQEFLRRLNAREGGTAVYRLPSEAEWEYAARASSTTTYSFGNTADALGRYAWYATNSGDITHPVGQLQPNAWGLYDMHGNVLEWVQDCWHDNYNGAPTDGRAWQTDTCTRRVVRGGSFDHPPEGLRSARRGFGQPEVQAGNLGVRCVRVPPQP